MSEQDFNKIFAKNLLFFMSRNNLNKAELAKALNVSDTTISNWTTGAKSARMSKIDEICKLFGINRDDLITDRTNVKEYYTDFKTQEIAQEIYEDKDLSLLFDAAKDASPEDLQTVYTMLKALKDKETNRYD